MTIKPSIQDLHESDDYRLVESFSIDEMSRFIAREARMSSFSQPVARTLKSAGLVVILIAAIGIGVIIGWLTGSLIKAGAGESMLSPLWQFVLAFVGFFLVLLPVHEAIHALVFKFLGAQKVGFGYSVRSMMVYAYAQRFVLTLRENALVAVMPFAVLTLLLAVLFFAVAELKVLWFILLTLHTIGCMGDFILIKYTYRNRTLRMFTYDDLVEGRTYFFASTAAGAEVPGATVQRDATLSQPSGVQN